MPRAEGSHAEGGKLQQLRASGLRREEAYGPTGDLLRRWPWIRARALDGSRDWRIRRNAIRRKGNRKGKKGSVKLTGMMNGT